MVVPLFFYVNCLNLSDKLLYVYFLDYFCIRHRAKTGLDSH